jgi:hypothetical protein
MLITVSGAPFAVTYPNGGESIDPSGGVTVTWTVGGGAVAPTVDILLSLDSGATWIPLAAGTPNDGSETLQFSVGQTTSTCRIKIAAVGNIFYDVSHADFTLQYTVDAGPGPLPHAVALHAPRPNPSIGAAAVDFDLPQAARVDLSIYSVLGQRLRTLAFGPWPAGRHSVAWDGKDQSGARLGSGVYFMRLDAGGVRAAQQVLRLR